MSRFKYIHRRLCEKLEIPEDSVGNVSRLQIIGNCAILCGCKKILKYQSDEIDVLTKDGTVRFLGEHLKCLYFFEETIEICGEICVVRLDKK